MRWLYRVAEFEAVLLEWFAQARPGIPVLMLPDAPPAKAGSCVSCGADVQSGWRCADCLAAVNHVLSEFAK